MWVINISSLGARKVLSRIKAIPSSLHVLAAFAESVAALTKKKKKTHCCISLIILDQPRIIFVDSLHMVERQKLLLQFPLHFEPFLDLSFTRPNSLNLELFPPG